VRVIVVKDEAGEDKLGFEFLDGPVTPKPEKLPQRRTGIKRRRGGGPRRSKPPPGPKGAGPPSGRGSVPKVPLVKA